MKRANSPFQFVAVSYLTRISNQVATTPAELRDGLEKCSDASIFYHTFQSLGRHHFLTEGFSNDFAQWALASLNRAELAERMAALDIRSYLELNELRNDLLRITDEFCTAYPNDVGREAFEPFYFCESIEVTVPQGSEAWTLEDFRGGLEHLGHGSINYHLLMSRLRLQLRTNDFSQWFAKELEMESLAQRTNSIDIYTNTLDGARSKLLQFIDKEIAA
jgi:hypothetical protein